MRYRHMHLKTKLRASAVILSISAGIFAPDAAQAQSVACADDPIYRQQDFALGDWDVYHGDKKTAEVRLEPVLAGCAIRETWTSLSGKGNGLGLFTYSHVLKAWSYAWASDAGAATVFTGAASGANSMIYLTERPIDGGGTRIRHWTLAEQADHSILELSVGSDDGGKTWTSEYELVWKKRIR